jgi:integrase
LASAKAFRGQTGTFTCTTVRTSDSPAGARLADACRGAYGDVVLVLGLCGLRWGELAGLKVADIVQVPGPGLRVQRTVLASSTDGALYEDTPKTGRVRTVPLPQRAADVIAHRAEGRTAPDWIFAAPAGGPLSESNWKRSVAWVAATGTIGRPGLRVHDLRHTAASLWLASGADPKVVQRVLGHASAAMTMDLYGHLIDQNLWDAADRIGGTTGAHRPGERMQKAPGNDVPRA